MSWVPRSAYSRGRVIFKGASNSSTSYVAANIDSWALGRYVQCFTVLELPSKARHAVLRRLESAVGPRGLGTPDPPAKEASIDPRGQQGFRAVTLNLRRGLGAKVQAYLRRCRVYAAWVTPT